MVEEYCRSLLKVAVAQLCQGLGWHAIHTTPCDLLTDVLQRYLEHLARHSHRYAEQYGRTDPNLDDVGLAFSHMQVRLNELETYLKEVEPIPFAHPVPTFPVCKRNNLQIPQPGSRDCRERLEYIPEHMPPLVDIAGEFGEGLDAMDVSHSSRTSFDTDGYEPHTPLMSPTSPRGEKRDLLSPTDYFAFKRLRMMDDGTPRELTAVSIGINGEITPKREGRLPVATTPPQKTLVERRGAVPVVPLPRVDSKPDGLLTRVPKSPRPAASLDSKAAKGKGITPPKPKPKSPKHLFFSPGGAPSVFQVKPKSPAVVIMDKVKELMPSGSKNIKVTGPNIGTLLITTKKTAETPPNAPAHHSDEEKSPSPKKPSALDVYDFDEEDAKPKTSKTFDPCGELPDPSKAVLPSATLIRDDEEEVVANAASIDDSIESVISKMSRTGDLKSGKKNGKDSERERTKEKGKEKSKEKAKDKNSDKGKGGLLDVANKSSQEKSSGKGHSLPPKLLFKHAWRESEGAITSAIKVETSPGLAPRLLIKTSDSKDKRDSKDKKDKLKKSGDEKSSSKESKKERSRRKKEQLKKEKLKKKKLEKKRRLQELAGKTTGFSGEEAQTDSQKQPTIAKLNIITKNPKSMKVRLVSQSESPASSPSREKLNEKNQKDKMRLKKKRKEKERKAKVKAARESLKKAKRVDGSKKPGEKRKQEDRDLSEEPPEKTAKLTVPKLMLKIGSASSSGEATKIIIKKQSENPKPQKPTRARTPSSSSSSSSSSPSPSPSPRHKSPSPSPPPRSPSPPSRSPSPPPKKIPAPKKAAAAKKSSAHKKTPAVLSPESSPPVPKSPSPPKSPPPPKVPVTVPPVRKAASKAFSAIAKPTKVSQPLSPGASQASAPIKGISVPTKASLKAPVEKPSTSKGAGKGASSQKAPGTPPPSGGVTVGGSAQRSVILETVGTVVSDTGEKIWICPNCKLPDDGSPMVGCDTCDDWYHWPCVGIKEEPKEANWYCPRCRVPKKKKGKKKYR